MKATILGRPEFVAFSERELALFAAWRAEHLSTLTGLTVGSDPKALIRGLSEDLLSRFAQAELVDKYDVYQHLMDYWAEVMQDDVYQIAQDGWKEAAKLRVIVDDKDKKTKETPDLIISTKKYKADLIPPALIVARYFAKEQAAIDALQAAKDAISQELEAFIEEHNGEEGLLEDAKTDKGKVTKASVKARMKELLTDEVDASLCSLSTLLVLSRVDKRSASTNAGVDTEDELAVLRHCQELLDNESEADKNVKDAQKALDAKVFAQYAKLSETEIKQLAVEDKWLATIEASVQAQVERVTQSLATRIKTLEERYADPMPKLTDEVSALSLRVDEHLKRMGMVWGS